MSDFEKKSLTTNHILKWTWFVQKPIFMNDLLEENHFSILLPRKTPNSLGMRFLKNHDMEKNWKKNSFWIKTFEKNQILKQVFNNASDFESRVSKYVRFLVNSTQLVIFESEFLPRDGFWNIFFTTRQILNRIFNDAKGFYKELNLKNEFFLDSLLSKNLSKHVRI